MTIQKSEDDTTKTSYVVMLIFIIYYLLSNLSFIITISIFNELIFNIVIIVSLNAFFKVLNVVDIFNCGKKKKPPHNIKVSLLTISRYTVQKW